jgi:hypothetical protein
MARKKATKMTQYEMLTLILSSLAILTAIASPVITYYWLDPQLQAFRNRARLQIEDAYHVNTQVIPAKSPGELTRTIAQSNWSLLITNTGALPAKDVQIVFRYEQINENETRDPKFVFEPPTTVEQTAKDNEITVLLKRPIAPEGELRLTTSDEPNDVWVYNEFGEGSNIRTSKGRDNLIKHALPICPVR